MARAAGTQGQAVCSPCGARPAPWGACGPARGSPVSPGKMIWFCKSSSPSGTHRPVKPWSQKPAQGWRNTPSPHPAWEPPCSSDAPLLLPTSSPRAGAGQSPGGLTEEAPWIAQATEGVQWDVSHRGFKGEGRLCSSQRRLPSPGTGCPGGLRNLGGTTPSTLGNRQESDGLVHSCLGSGQACFQPEMRAGSGFSSGDKLRLQLRFAFPRACSAPSIRSHVLPAPRGRNRVMLSARS